MKLAKKFKGVPDGFIYPVVYGAGEDCPEELLAAATAAGALAIPDVKDSPKKGKGQKDEQTGPSKEPEPSDNGSEGAAAVVEGEGSGEVETTVDPDSKDSKK